MKVEEKTIDESIAEFTWDDDDSSNSVNSLDNNEKPTTLTDKEKEKLTKEPIVEENEETKDDESVTDKEKEEAEVEEKEETVDDEEEFDFSNDAVDDEEQKEEEKEVDEEKSDDFFKVLAAGLKDQGVFTNIDIPEDDIDEEKFVGLVEDEVESRINETFEGFFEEMDDDGKAFLKFKKEGGSTQQFFDTIKETSAVPTGDIDDEDYQKKFLKYYYKNVENLDDEDTEERLEYLEDNGKIEKFAKKYQSKVEEIQEKKKLELENKIKRDKEFEEQTTKEFHDKLRSTLENTDSIKDFAIPKNEKNELFNFITKPSVKVGKNKFITGLQEGLQKASKDYNSLILLAKMVKSDFDVSGIEKKQATKQARKLKTNLQRAKKNIKPSTNGGSGKSQLSDFFN